MTYQKPKLAISFSGGRTSAVMTKLLLDQYRDDYSEIEVVFCNTGQEHEATLEFVKDCDEQWGFNTVWLEGVTNHRRGVGTTHRIVNFEHADRAGYPFETMVQKYGIPGPGYLHCTRELKEVPFRSYLKGIGWKDHKIAIGIRADEIDRTSPGGRFIYPMADWGWTKEMVNAEVRRWPFDLKIPNDAHGNCVWCWKKSFRKLYTLAKSNPEYFDFPMMLEDKYKNHGAGNDPRILFRKRTTTREILKQSQTIGFTPYQDDPPQEQLSWLDVGGGCGESCEIGADN